MFLTVLTWIKSTAGVVVSDGAAQQIQQALHWMQQPRFEGWRGPAALMCQVAAAFRGRHQKGRDADPLQIPDPNTFLAFSQYMSSPLPDSTGVKRRSRTGG